MDREEIAKKLWAAAERRAESHGVQFGPGAGEDIRKLAERGATRISADPAANNDSIQSAESAFEKLIDEMVAAAAEIPGYAAAHPGHIGEHTLAQALARLRPLFPIG